MVTFLCYKWMMIAFKSNEKGEDDIDPTISGILKGYYGCIV